MKEQWNLQLYSLSTGVVTRCSLLKQSRLRSVKTHKVVIFTCPIKESRMSHVWESTWTQDVSSQDSTVRAFELSYASSVNLVYCRLPCGGEAVSVCVHVDKRVNPLRFISANSHDKRRQWISVALPPDRHQLCPVSSHTPHWNPYSWPVCVCVNTTLHHQNTERPWNMNHPTLWTSGERVRHADTWKTDMKCCRRRTAQIWKIDWFADYFLFFFGIGLSVTSSCSFYVSTSLRLCVPEMTTSQTLWVRRLTARPAAAMLERINARGKTSARPLTPGSLRPTSPGWFSDWYILLLYIELWHLSLSVVIPAL